MNFLSGFIAIVGPPNVGKSTLLNRFLGEKIAIVSPKPQTTRNRIIGVLHAQDYQIVFLDTPGIHRPRTVLHKSMVASAEGAISEVDIILMMVEMHKPEDPGIQMILRGMKRARKPVILAINKIDTGPKENLLPMMAQFGQEYPFEEIVPISALEGDGVELLLGALKARLRPGPEFFPPDVRTDQSKSFLISEIIREKIYFHTRNELPYASAVTVEKQEDRPDRDLISISARIHVETDNQKAILIGKGGRMIKTIGQSSRTELEGIFGSRIYLDLTVRVEKNWSRDTRALRRLGY